jgi:hypothetical protein
LKMAASQPVKEISDHKFRLLRRYRRECLNGQIEYNY